MTRTWSWGNHPITHMAQLSVMVFNHIWEFSLYKCNRCSPCSKSYGLGPPPLGMVLLLKYDKRFPNLTLSNSLRIHYQPCTIAKADNCLSNGSFIMKCHETATTWIIFVVVAEQVENITHHIFTLSHFSRTKSVSHKNKTRSWNVPNPYIKLSGTEIHLVNLSDMLLIVLGEFWEIYCKGVIFSQVSQIRHSRKTWSSLIQLCFDKVEFICTCT